MLPVIRSFLAISCGIYLLAVFSGATTIASAAPISGQAPRPLSPPAALPDKISIKSVPMILNPALVPPDPGEASKDTLTGVDRNNNGIRDDVERWIAKNHPTCARYRAALAQVALSIQRRMTPGDLTEEAAHQMALEGGNATSCYAAEVTSCESASLENFIEFSILQQNTPERAKAYIRVFKKLEGKAFVSPTQGNGCSIPSDQLPN